MSESANIALLEKIVAAQRKIIAESINTNLAGVPQLWALYKEVQEYYEKGMRVPDDVTLAVVRRQLGKQSAAADAGPSRSAAAARGFIIILTMWAGRGITNG